MPADGAPLAVYAVGQAGHEVPLARAITDPEALAIAALSRPVRFNWRSRNTSACSPISSLALGRSGPDAGCMVPSEAAPYDQALVLCARGDGVLDSLRSMVQQAEQAHAAFLDDSGPLLQEADKAVEKDGMEDVVTSALKQLQQAWIGVLEREVRFFDLIVEVERIHEELFAIVTTQDKSP